jgi:dTDP-4-amino-4,6-dideoxy-D-galactose acyltransferase
VDVRVTLDRASAEPAGLADGIRPALPEELPELIAIASESHTDSRFYADPGFPRERCAALYRTWIEKGHSDFASEVLVAERDSRPGGYVVCERSGDTGRIGLLAVAPWTRGRGAGRSLVNASVAWFQRERIPRITVVTQGRNVSAQRLYQSCGFLTCSVQLWFHRWFS